MANAVFIVENDMNNMEIGRRYYYSELILNFIMKADVVIIILQLLICIAQIELISR